MGKKEYNTKNIASVWMNTNKKTGEDFVSVQMVESEDDNGKPNKYYGLELFGRDVETGKVYKLNKLKTFEGKGHPSLLANICAELNDEEYATLVTDDEE